MLHLQLQAQSLADLKGVGPKMQAKFAQKGIMNVYDLLLQLPIR